MQVTVYPSKCSGTLIVPPSKSLSHRYLIASALTNGETTLHNLYLSRDVRETLITLGKLSTDFQLKGGKLIINGNDDFSNVSGTLNIEESITTLRLILPLLSLSQKRITIKLGKRLVKHSLEVYSKIWKQQTLFWQKKADTLTIEGKLTAGNYKISSNIASQFISGLLFALPLLDKQSTLIIPNKLESYDFIDLTIQVLKEFGIDIIKAPGNRLIIPAPQIYLNPQDIVIESDYSQAANFMVLAAINSPLTINQMPQRTLQGAAKIIDILKDKGAQFTFDKNNITIENSLLSGSTVDFNSCWDLVPIVCVLAAFCKEKTLLTNIRPSTLVEADRLEFLSKELHKVGIKIKFLKNSATVFPLNKPVTRALKLESYNDHRIIMALAILATMLPFPTTIYDCQAVEKSYPSFFDDLGKIGIQFQITK